MGFDKVKCYICQADLPDKSSVIKHIQRKHADHLTTRAYIAYAKMNDADSLRMQTQTDVVKVVVNRPDVKLVEEKTKEISNKVTVERAKDAASRKVMNPESAEDNTSNSEDATEKSK